VQTVSITLAPAEVGIYTGTQYVCLRASQFESESKIRAEQYVGLRTSQFENESKSRAEQYV
jgi:hypothetical protein